MNMLITKREVLKQEVAPTSSVLSGVLQSPTTATSLPAAPPKAQRKCKECGIEGHYRKNCPSLPCSDCGGRGHVGNKCSARIEAAKETKKIANMTPEQVALQNESHRIANMNPDQADKQRVSHQVENLPAAQYENKKASDSAFKRKRKQSGLLGLVGERNLTMQDADIPNSAVNRDAKKYQVGKSQFNMV